MRKKILIVDDDQNLRNIFCKALKNLYIIDCAKDGREGLTLFFKGKYHLVITDNEMPVMTGIEMIKEIKKSNSKLPIVIITGDTSFVSEFDDIKVLYKPFTINTMKYTVFNILNLI